MNHHDIPPNRWQWNAACACWQLDAGICSMTVQEWLGRWLLRTSPGRYVGLFDTADQAKEAGEEWAATTGLRILLALPIQSPLYS